MTMKVLVLITLLICGFQSSKGQEIIRIDLNEYKKHFRQPDLSEIASDIEFVKLETQTNCLVGGINRIVRCGKSILILANSKKSLLLFSENGKFIRKIGNLGKGPGEYVEIYGLSIDPLTQHIYVLDNGQVKIIEYLANGDFAKETKLGFYATDVLPFVGGFLFYTGSPYAYKTEGYALTSTTKDYKSKGRFHSLPDLKGKPYRLGTFYQNNTEVCFWEPYWDTVFAFDGNNVKPRYYFEQGKEKIPKKFLSDTKLMWSEIDKYFYLNSFTEFRNFIYFEVIDVNRKAIRIVYDKVKKIGFYINYREDFSNWGFTDNISGGPLFTVGYKISMDEAACVFEIIDLKDLLTKGKINEKIAINKDRFTELKDLINKSSVQDNPILVITKLK